MDKIEGDVPCIMGEKFGELEIWNVLVQLFVLGLICHILHNIMQNILGMDLNVVWIATFYIFAPFIMIRSLRMNGVDAEVIGEPSVQHVPWILLISIKFLLILFSWLSQSVGVPLASLVYPKIYTEVLSLLSEHTHVSADVNSILMLIISFTFVPIFEELLFRGYLLNKWRDKIGLGKAIIMSSLLFACVHFDIMLFLGYFASGIFYSLVYLRTKRLIVPIILHSLTNLVSSFTTFLPSLPLTSIEELQSALLVALIVYLMLIPIIAFILYRFYKHTAKMSPHQLNMKKSS
ncbi:CPBP family intramembrane metalloprotease [Ornithinibacillus sp. BX22]|uniref:CPBP family intramembrane metalloprotease n=2 Tax=Ornithinibacillus TaxID=484508 RepID=A0A923L5D8_9BACI|nr:MULTISPECIES: CPBP family intramembrane glutamic endopeptidase [Ornithinibacillus]MBC5636782.1 CPBP family intramembrane metalloprotease [Ornithinibacillus hominis]MBS3681348.1 CPBP family intramembrane metalloprotease [Ornithinibacillus massiliensis]